MSLTRNKVKSVIKKSFIKKLKNLGFKQRKDSLGGYRVRGDFVDVVSIQIGSNPGSLYLHYFTNLLADPFTDLLNSIAVGERLMGTENDGEPWITEVEEEIHPILDSIWQSVEGNALPFFESTPDIQKFTKLLEKSQEGRPYPLALALVYAATGKYEKSSSLLLEIKEKMIADECFDFDDDEEDIELMKCLDSLSRALENESVKNLIEEWSENNLILIDIKK